jgi:outer membrane protein TolC
MLSLPWSSLRFWSRIGAVGGLIASVAAAQRAPAAVQGLPEDLLPGLGPILQAAVTRAPEAIRASIDVAAAEARRTIGESVLRPSVNANLRYGVNQERALSHDAGSSNTSSGFFYGIGATQPVYHWGALKAQADRDRIGVTISQRLSEETYRQLLLTLRRAYLELVARKGALRALEEQLKLDQAALADDEEKFRAGLIAAGALGGTRLTVEQRQIDIDRARAELDAGRRTFSRAAGIPELAAEAIPDTVTRPAAAAGAGEGLLQAFLQQGGAEQTPQAQALALGIRQSEQSYLIASRRLFPKFSIYTGYDIRNETQAESNRIRQVQIAAFSYGLKADWSIFDGRATAGEKRLALAQKRENERRLESHLESVKESARAQAQQLDLARRQLDIAERTVSGAEAVLKESQDEFAAGRASAADVERAKLAVTGAKARIVPTRADYLMRWAEFVSLVGADPAMNNLPVRHAR